MIGELAALGAAISWTVSALFYGKALETAKPISANIIRLTLTGGFLMLFFAVLGKLPVLASLSLQIAVLAGVSGIVGLGIGDTLYMVSLRRIGVARAVPITCVYPLFSLLWGAFLLGEQVTWAVAFGAVVIVVGIWFLGQDSQVATTGAEKRALVVGMLFALATAVVWSISITMMDVAVKETPDLDHALAINTIRVISIAALMFAASPLVDRKFGFMKARRKTVIALVAGGIVALGLGWFLLTYSFVETSQSRAVPISSTTPLFSTLVGVLLLHERVTVRTALGSIMIVVGIFLIFLV